MAAPSYRQSRMLILVAGAVVLLATAGIMLVRSYNPAQVLGVVLFLPVFAISVLGGVRWGFVTALAATGAYAGLQNMFYSGFFELGASATSNIVLWGAGYVVFGVLSGWAAGVVGDGITKLDRFDVTDDDSELLNARGVHRQLSQEAARAARYDTDFAVVTVSFALEGDVRETRHRIGEVVRECVRTVDDVGRVTIDGKDVIVAVLPETPAGGAEIVGNKVTERLDAEVAHVAAEVRWLTHPEDDDAIQTLLGQLEQIVRIEHPEAVS